MEHSVQAYLERRTSAELMNFLDMCRLQNEWARYVDTIPGIFALLEKRDVQVPERISEAWNRFSSQWQ